MKHSIDNPIEKQAIFENHHEPIIDLQTWERVQELRKQRKRPNRYDDVGLFSGLLFCADCGHVMYQQRYQTDKRSRIATSAAAIRSAPPTVRRTSSEPTFDGGCAGQSAESDRLCTEA